MSTDKTLQELMTHNEAIHKELTRLREINSIYRKALLDLKKFLPASMALETARRLEKNDIGLK